MTGYKAGEVPLPSPPVTVSVTDFGAQGDGSNDDTQAFLNAIDATSQGVIYIPPGMGCGGSGGVQCGTGKGRWWLQGNTHGFINVMDATSQGMGFGGGSGL